MSEEGKWGKWDYEWGNQAVSHDDYSWDYVLIPNGWPGLVGFEWVFTNGNDPCWRKAANDKAIASDRIFRRPKQAAKPAWLPVPPVSIRILEQAAQIQRDRSATYDQGGTMEGERSMGRTVQAFNTITGRDLSESEGWLLLQILKDVRDRANGPHEDSLVDCTSYSSLKAEARLKEGRQ